MLTGSVLWRRLDTPGHDACRLARSGDGWKLDGTAVFIENGLPACLAYDLVCDPAWFTRRGGVRGWIGGRSVELRVERTAGGRWTLDHVVVPGLEGCVDLDLGFTPATNLAQLRRVALAEGEATDVPVAWLDVSSGVPSVLEQRYERQSDEAYWYEAPRFDYRGLLEVDPVGFVRCYPGLWEAVG